MGKLGWIESKNAGRNINNLRYVDNTTLLAEREELKSFLMKAKKESEKVGLKLNIQKTKIMADGPITSWEIDGETIETGTDFNFMAAVTICCNFEAQEYMEWVDISFSRGSSRSRDRTQVSRIAGRLFTTWATKEAPEISSKVAS